MNVLLVIPKFGDVENTEAFIPIGTAYINAAIRRAGFNVDAINLNYRTKEELMEKIKFCDVILCGGTAHDWLKLRELFRLARNINPSVITVGGGAGYSSSPLVFSEITEVDYAVIGEGERTTCNVLSAIATGASIEEVKGVVYKYSDKYIYTGAAPIIGDFDSIPFPSYEGLDIDEYFAHQQGMRKRKMGEKNYFQFQYEYSDEPKELPMMLSRSCPFLCTFCFHTLGNKYRMRSLDNFFSELDELIEKYQINGIYLIDELFGLNEKIITAFCERISEYKIRWFAEIRIETASRSVLKKMQEAGCQNVQFGVENICDAILQNMNKKTDKNGIEMALKNAYDAGMIVSGNMLVGAENETWDTFIENFDWWNHNRQYDLAMINIIQYPGSAYHNHCLAQGIIQDQKEFIMAGMPILNMSMMSNSEWDKMNRMIRLSQKNKAFQGEIYSITPVEDSEDLMVSTECSYCQKKYSVRETRSDWKQSTKFASSCPHCGRRNVHDKTDYRRDFQYELQQQWISNMIQGESVVDWLLDEKIHTVGVWCNGDLGTSIIQTLAGATGIDLTYIVDKTNDRQLHFHYRDIRFVDEIEMCSYKVDCLVVCESAEFIAERKKLRQIGYKGKIISSADLIFGHEFYLQDAIYE